MAHELVPTKHPHLAHVRIKGDLLPDDMTCDDALGLNTGKPVYVLADLTTVYGPLPGSFLEDARRSFFVNPNLQQLALVTRSGLLRSLALLIGKMTGRRDKMSLHDTVAEAEAHLMALIRRRGL